MKFLELEVNGVMFLLEKKVLKGKKEGDLKEYWHFGQFVQIIQNWKKNIIKILKFKNYLI